MENTYTEMEEYQKFIALSRYARYIPEKNRRETWEETVHRYINFFKARCGLSDDEATELFEAKRDLEVMGSMRATMTAGPALERDLVAGYNCSFLAVDGHGEEITMQHEALDEGVVVHIKDPVSFDEMMYILMCGTGVGYSTERQFTNDLPKVGKKLNRRRCLPNNKNYPGVPKHELSTIDRKTNVITVQDSKYGWASALRILIFELYNGNHTINWDTSLVRAEGEKLKVFGGRSSGPRPLEELFSFAKSTFIDAMGRKLSSLEAHDLCCKIADVVVVGGVEA